MRAFRFPLQAVLRLREREEDLARRAFARSLAALRLCEQECSRWRTARQEAARQLFLPEAQPLPGSLLVAAAQHAQYLEQRVSAAEQHRAAAAEQALHDRAAWLEARRRYRLLLRLRERAHADNFRELGRAQERELSEIATLRHASRRAELGLTG